MLELRTDNLLTKTPSLPKGHFLQNLISINTKSVRTTPTMRAGSVSSAEYGGSGGGGGDVRAGGHAEPALIQVGVSL